MLIHDKKNKKCKIVLLVVINKFKRRVKKLRIKIIGIIIK